MVFLCLRLRVLKCSMKTKLKRQEPRKFYYIQVRVYYSHQEDLPVSRLHWRSFSTKSITPPGGKQ